MNVYEHFFDNSYFDWLIDNRRSQDADKCMLTTGDKILAFAKRFDALYVSRIDIYAFPFKHRRYFILLPTSNPYLGTLKCFCSPDQQAWIFGCHLPTTHQWSLYILKYFEDAHDTILIMQNDF